MQIAIKKGEIDLEELGHINCHATSTSVGDEAEGRAIQRLLKNKNVPLMALKGYIGHSFGAAGGNRVDNEPSCHVRGKHV